MTNFSPKKVNKYIDQVRKKLFKNNEEMVKINEFRTDAILSLFDKNKDGKISQQEFKNISEENYSIFSNELKAYNQTQGDNSHIYTYNELENFLKKGYIDNETLEGYKIEILNPNLTLKETKGLKDPKNMSKEEIQKEYESYELKPRGREFIHQIRQEKNKMDENSNIVDWHIGTFNQEEFSTCTILANINLLTDEDLKQYYKKKQDKKGNIYYEVNFPIDNGKKSVKITEEELNSKTLKYKNDEIIGFSTGDKDALLLEMAYVKRFGTKILHNGEMPDTAMNRFLNNNAKTYNNITEDLLTNDKPKLIGLLNTDYLEKEKNISYGNIELSSGENAKLYEETNNSMQTVGKQRLKLPNGTIIYGNHSYTVKGYNPETKEVTITNPHENSTDIKIPFELMKLFDITE